MATFHRISIEQARRTLNSSALLLDIRDAASFAHGHVAQALHLHGDMLAGFIEQTPRQTPLLVVCYHGISSQNVAHYLAGQGFQQVYSVDGGMQAWQQQFPQDIILNSGADS